MKYSFGKNINLILLLVFFLYFSTFLFLPYFAIFLSEKSISVMTISVVMTIIIIFQQGVTFFVGVAGDIYGYKKLILIGIILRIISFILLLISNDISLIILASILFGFGTACTIPNIKSVLIVLSDKEQNKTELLAARSIVLNTSAAIGPIASALLFNINYKWVIFLIITLHFGCLFTLFFVKNPLQNRISSKKIHLKNVLNILKNTNLVKILIINIPFSMMFSQLNFSLPIYIKDIFNDIKLIGVLFTINALFMIFLQVPILKRALAWKTEEKILSISILIFSLSFLLLAFSESYWLFILFILLFSTAEVLYTPVLDRLSSDYADKSNLSAYFGLISLSGAIGSILGNQIIGFLYTYLNPKLAFITLVFIALCSLIYYLKKETR